MNLKILLICKDNPQWEGCKYSLFIFTYITPIIILIGLLGNTLSLVVLWRRPLTKTSSYIYLASIAVVDLGMIFIGLKTYIEFLVGKKIMDYNTFFCKFHDITVFSNSYLSIWLIVAMTVDRLIAVCFPLKAWNFSKPNRCKKTIILLAVTIFCSNIFWLFFNDIDANTKFCKRSVGNLFSMIDSIFYSFLPSILLIIGNALIIHNINKSNFQQKKFANIRESSTKCLENNKCTNLLCCYRKRQENNNKSNENGFVISERPIFLSASIRDKRQLTILLVTVSLLFLFLTTPVTIGRIIPQFSKSHIGLDTTAHLLSFLNHAINFIIYCSMGNKFRRQLKIILRGKKRRKNKCLIINGPCNNKAQKPCKNKNDPKKMKPKKIVFKDSSMREKSEKVQRVNFNGKLDEIKRRICFYPKQPDSNILTNDSYEIDTPIEFLTSTNV